MEAERDIRRYLDDDSAPMKFPSFLRCLLMGTHLGETRECVSVREKYDPLDQIRSVAFDEPTFRAIDTLVASLCTPQEYSRYYYCRRFRLCVLQDVRH